MSDIMHALPLLPLHMANVGIGDIYANAINVKASKR